MAYLKSIVFLGLALLLQSCGSTYAPTGQYGGIPHGGYGETRVSVDKFLVYFSGNAYNSDAEIKRYLLYRCAELTLNQGYDYFVVLSTTTSSLDVAVTTQSSTQQVAAYPRTYSRSTQYAGYQTREAYWPPADRRMKQGSQAYIQMFQGSIPPGLPHAFNAARLIAHFGSPP
jgi:hypothetical protein